MSKTAALGVEVGMASGEMALSSETRLGVAAEPSLVDGCRRGDPQAFARLVALHEGMVLNLALRLLGDPEEARDLAQDVFLQVYRTLPRFEGRSSLRTWIYRIVVNQCRNRQRWWRRRRRSAACPLDEVTAAEEARLAEATPTLSPFDRLARAERARRVQAALLRLSFEHRAILLLREVEGLTCDEIASTLALPLGTVKSRLSRARDGLRRGLHEDAQERP
ncbi:MAG TPA: sigma-70 family RNA polymerase sigma factor [Vicinamibacteria bacterium]|nr:sigma-70 family RNA polymerase sigma factor [Vicinamibacteria bacterium]